MSRFCIYSNSLTAWTLHPQGNERIAVDLCASAESFDSVFRKYARNVFAVNPISSRWPPVSCRLYLSQIIHQWPFYVSEKCSPTLGWGFWSQPLCFYFSWCSVQEHMGGHLLGILSGQYLLMLKTKDVTAVCYWVELLWAIAMAQFPLLSCKLKIKPWLLSSPCSILISAKVLK